MDNSKDIVKMEGLPEGENQVIEDVSEDVHLVPQVTVQHDFQDVLRDVVDGTVENEDFWVSVYYEGKESVHGRVGVSRLPSSSSGIKLDPKGVQWEGISPSKFKAGCKNLGVGMTDLRVPRKVYGESSKRPKRILAFDVSPNGERFAIGHQDGSISVTTVASPSTPFTTVQAAGHKSTVLSLRFFPSSVVLLSTSSDHTLKILDAQDPTLKCVRTFKGHTGGVTDCGMIERGRNVISSSRDGTVRLWDVPAEKTLAGGVWSSKGKTGILCMSVGSAWEGYQSAKTVDKTQEGEVGTDGKVVFVGLDNGGFEGLDLRSKTTLFSSLKTSSIRQGRTRDGATDSIAYDPSSALLATGSREGIVRVYDIRQLHADGGHALCSFKRNGAGVDSLSFCPERFRMDLQRRQEEGLNPTAVTANVNPATATKLIIDRAEFASGLPHLLVGTTDGLPWRAGLTADGGVACVEEYVGYECGDGVRSIRYCDANSGSMWCAGDDGLVRVYC